MLKINKIIYACFLMSLSVLSHGEEKPFSPTAISLDSKGKELVIAGKTANKISFYNLKKGKELYSLETSQPPTGVVSGKNAIWATLFHSEGVLLKIDPKNKKTQQIKAGHGACAPVLHPTRPFIYVANQFDNDISVIDRSLLTEVQRIEVLRQPVAQDIRPDGKYLFVANLLPAGRADLDTVAAAVSIIDLESGKLVKNILLANGSNALRGIKVSPDGRFVFISHNLGRFQVPTTQLAQGWMNTSALSVIDAQELDYVATVLLDEPTHGAAGSWGIDVTDQQIFVAHSGTHDYSRIEYKPFVDKLLAYPDKMTLSYDLNFLYDIRKRFKVSGNGPREILVAGEQLVVANYFTDDIDILNIDNPSLKPLKIELNKGYEPSIVRKGEIYFNDAAYCFQGWQSCNGCHPNDARTDGLNWDLLNDGIGNPKNCKSMLYSHVTSPAMITGIRPTAEIAVRAGFKHIQFAQVDEERAKAVDEYLKSLTPVPSPYLVDGKLSEDAQKGKEIFQKVNCSYCHPAPHFTDQRTHQMGRQGDYDHQNKWDTPTLIEIWRTAPYLHDGRCANLKEVFTEEKHGLKNHSLTGNEIDQLVEYILSL